jgi:DNA-binding NtrC family response regulator
MSATKPKLLVVDDETDMLDFLERVLRARFCVTRTSSPEDALALLKSGEYEVLVTDQKMPRMTGLELLERIGDRYPTLVKILISGFAEMPEIKRAVDRRSIHNYVVKPVDGERLLTAIEEAYAVRDGRPFEPVE